MAHILVRHSVAKKHLLRPTKINVISCQGIAKGMIRYLPCPNYAKILEYQVSDLISLEIREEDTNKNLQTSIWDSQSSMVIYYYM